MEIMIESLRRTDAEPMNFAEKMSGKSMIFICWISLPIDTNSFSSISNNRLRREAAQVDRPQNGRLRQYVSGGREVDVEIQMLRERVMAQRAARAAREAANEAAKNQIDYKF